jgi:hypothetical protein
MAVKKILLVCVLALIMVCSKAQYGVVTADKGVITVAYKDKIVFSGKLPGDPGQYRIHSTKQTINNAAYQVITINAVNGERFDLAGNIYGSDESIACESTPRDKGLKVVRHVVGQSHNLLNNAVYNRKEDWLLSVDNYYPATSITPGENHQYAIDAKGSEIIIRFLPLYYQKHRGLAYFNPAEYTVWQKPVVGWCSWFAYLNQVTEVDVKKTADVISEKLKPYGLEYLQIDDGYQQVPIGLPNTWLQPNAKFPSGLQGLASYIQSKGLTPGIWTNVSFADSAQAYKHTSLFVKDSKGNPAYGNWVGYIMDGSNPQAVNRLFKPVYAGLKNDGWQYFKLDALRHLKYEGYNSYAEYFAHKNYDRNEAFRNVVKEVRKQIGKENYLLACWGIRPELVGIVDGCRIGNDGYSYAGLAQYNSYNNIIWRNDPDHIELTAKEAYRSCTATSLTGSAFMLTDKPTTYESSPLIEAAKRSIPVLYTQPGQVYDVDPSKSSSIQLADVEMSGSGPRPFDAGSSTTTGLFALEINKPFENWMVLGRLDERDRVIPFRDLGLDANKQYLVFEFWTKQFEGVFTKQFEPGAIDSGYGCQAFCFREKQPHPQLLATNRHISCGGYELNDVQWKDNTLTGTSELVAGDPYEIYVYEPGDAVFNSVISSNAVVVSSGKTGNIRKVVLSSVIGGRVTWGITYK